jgi:hypothetical protein
VSGRVGDHCIQLSATEDGFINAHYGTDIVLVKNPFLCMIKLGPLTEVAYKLLVLPGQVASVHSVMRSYRTDTLGSGVNPRLLKKPRTPG